MGASAQPCAAEELPAWCRHCPPPCPHSDTPHRIAEEWSCRDERRLKIEHNATGLLCWHTEQWPWEREPMLGIPQQPLAPSFLLQETMTTNPAAGSGPQ